MATPPFCKISTGYAQTVPANMRAKFE